MLYRAKYKMESTMNNTRKLYSEMMWKLYRKMQRKSCTENAHAMVAITFSFVHFDVRATLNCVSCTICRVQS